MTLSTVQARDVLDFWFLPPEHPEYLQPRAAWFQKNPAFDAEIEAQFGPLVAQAVAQGLPAWENDHDGRLASVIVLDQFTRNIYRDTPAAFSGDARALQLARDVVEPGADQAYAPVQRSSFYLPYMHAEDLPTQEVCVALYARLAEAWEPARSNLDFAVKHRDIIARFGRFPHRNAILGRDSTPEELVFLQQPGSSF